MIDWLINADFVPLCDAVVIAESPCVVVCPVVVVVSGVVGTVVLVVA